MICKNPECRKQINQRKSAKRCYCNDRCKNRAAYIRRLEKDKHIILSDKKMKKNYRILQSLKKKELGPIGLQTLNSHEFDFELMHKDIIVKTEDGTKKIMCQVYDIIFELNDNKQLEFV
jgi:endogenous inhibitor of DNA gyrase (YacG/DUF329 family)